MLVKVTSINLNPAALAYHRRVIENTVREATIIEYKAYLTYLEYPFGVLPEWSEWDANPWVWCCVMVKGTCTYEGRHYEFEEYREGCRFKSEEAFLKSVLYRNMKDRVVSELVELIAVEVKPHYPALSLPAPSMQPPVYQQLRLL